MKEWIDMGIRIQPQEIDVPEEDPFRNDLLGRKSSVEVLTHLLGSIEGPCVLAVDAGWGAGKTTFLRIWAQHLRNEAFPVVEFNAWETDFAGDPFVALSTELTEALTAYDERAGQALKDKIARTQQLAKEVARRSVPSLIRLATWGILDVQPLMEKELGEALAAYAKKESTGYEEARAAVDEFREALRDIAQESRDSQGSRPVVVVIDELDRCRPTYAVELLEAAKHLFAVDGILFVLGVNRSELAHSVTAIYGGGFDAKGYLRRFVDLEFRLPEPGRSQFVEAALDTIRIGDFFSRTEDENARLDQEAALVRQWLPKFFGSPDLDLRRIAQAVHHLGLVFASLRTDQRSFALTAVVALIVRTIDPELYFRFTCGAATDLEVVDRVFAGNLGQQRLQLEHPGCMFEVMIASAAHEVSGRFNESIDSPLLARYEKLLDTETPDSPARKHAAKVLELYRSLNAGFNPGRFGFLESVKRLELLSRGLLDQGE